MKEAIIVIFTIACMMLMSERIIKSSIMLSLKHAENQVELLERKLHISEALR